MNNENKYEFNDDDCIMSEPENEKSILNDQSSNNIENSEKPKQNFLFNFGDTVYPSKAETNEILHSYLNVESNISPTKDIQHPNVNILELSDIIRNTSENVIKNNINISNDNINNNNNSNNNNINTTTITTATANDNTKNNKNLSLAFVDEIDENEIGKDENVINGTNIDNMNDDDNNNRQVDNNNNLNIGFLVEDDKNDMNSNHINKNTDLIQYDNISSSSNKVILNIFNKDTVSSASPSFNTPSSTNIENLNNIDYVVDNIVNNAINNIDGNKTKTMDATILNKTTTSSTTTTTNNNIITTTTSTVNQNNQNEKEILKIQNETEKEEIDENNKTLNSERYFNFYILLFIDFYY